MQSFSLQIYYKRMWVCKVYWEFYEHLLFWPLRKSIFWKTIEWDISIEARGVFNDPRQAFINFVLNSFLDKKCFENSQKKHTYKVAYLKKGHHRGCFANTFPIFFRTQNGLFTQVFWAAAFFLDARTIT